MERGVGSNVQELCMDQAGKGRAGGVGAKVGVMRGWEAECDDGGSSGSSSRWTMV